MATFDESYASLDPDVGIRGKQFEKFVKWFLKTDPTWANQIDEVWLWNDYPKRWWVNWWVKCISGVKMVGKEKVFTEYSKRLWWVNIFSNI